MELKIEDLRIGNYVIYEATTHVINGIDSLSDEVASWWVNHKTNTPAIEYDGDKEVNPYISSTKYHKGIPITIKELEKFDINHDHNPNAGKFGGNWEHIFYPAGNIKVRFFEDNMTVVAQGSGITSIVEIKYLHELQNLVYFLYKKELIFKEISE